MSDLEKFLQQMQQDDEAQKKLAAVKDWKECTKLWVDMASEKGLSISEAEVENYLHAGTDGDLSEADLEQVSGSGWTSKCKDDTWNCENSCSLRGGR